MDENKEFIPALTLDPNGTQSAAAVMAPTAEGLAEAAKVSETENTAPAEKLDIDRLSPAEQAAVREFAAGIDIMKTDQILNYGSAAQKNIADFSAAALEKVRTKDMGEVGDMLSNLVVQLKGLNFDEEEKKGLKGLFKKSANTIAVLKAQYDKAEVNIDKIASELDLHEVTLDRKSVV